ncbi:MAG: TonB-dependent receptor [Sediminicola sp.]
MKKPLESSGNSPWILKFDLKMKLSLLFLITTSFLMQANSSYSQRTKLSLDMGNTTVEEVIDEIESQSEFKFFFNTRAVDLKRRVSIKVSQMPIKQVLNLLFKADRTSFTIENRKILLKGRQPAFDAKDMPLPLTVVPQNQVSGTVTDTNGTPLPGANIVEQGTTNGVTADFDGNFTIALSNDAAVLVVSYIGFAPKEVAAEAGAQLTVVLEESAAGLDEVVVVGYGTQKKVNLTGAVSVVDNEELAQRQVGQSSMLLQGVAPGVVVTQRSGQPGSDGGIISIRGKTTLGSNDPLILVDGVQRNLNSIDPSMIESISVLKDAASASIYGSRAAAGVILVTTKRAKSEKLSISYNSYFGKQDPTDLPQMVNALDHMDLINEAYTNTGRSQLYNDEFINTYRANMAANPDLYPDTDWYDGILTGYGLMQNHFVNINGGSEKARISASLGFYDQEGIIANTGYKRYSLSINTDLNITDKLTSKIDAHLIYEKSKEPSRGVGSVFHWAGRIPANQGGQLSDGRWGEGWNGDNPIAFSRDGGLHTTEEPSVVLNLGLIYQPTEWAKVDLFYSPNYSQDNNSTFIRSIQTYSGDGSPSYLTPQFSTLRTNHNRSLLNNLRSTITLDKTYGDHSLKFLAGYQQEDFRTDFLEGYRENFAFPDYPVLDSGGEDNQQSNGRASEWALQSVFSRLNYSLLDRYLFEANIRFDGSSRFVDGRKWGTFPSFSAGWRISEEPFFEGIKSVVNELKVRGSWGQLGNQQIGNYPFSSEVNLGLSYVFDNQIVNGAGLTALANENISWETTTETNIGVDITLFNRLSLVGEYYTKTTDDILLPLDIPRITGLTAPQQNAGKVENKGWEVGVNYRNWDREFKYQIGVNLADVSNKVLDLRGVENAGLTVSHEGHEMFSIYGLEADGLIQESDFDASGNYMGPSQYGNFAAGDIKYIDQNGDNIIDSNDYKILGGTIPRYTYGINFDSKFKNFDLSFFIQGVGKANGLIREQGIMPFFLGGTLQEQHKDRWTPDNTDPTFPRLAFNETNNEQTSSFWMKDASYLRLKNMQFGFTIPQIAMEKMGIQRLRLYVSGQNLFSLDDFWDGYDVEAQVGNGGYYPQVRTFSLGIDLNF